MAAPMMSTEQIREAWDRIASGFDEFVTPDNIDRGEEILRHADVRAGQRFLDVAAGTGGLSIPAARLGAEVVATDLSPAMIDRLIARARAEGLDNVHAAVMDGTALDLDDDVVDVAASLNGVSLFPDLDGGLRELARVVKPSGRVLIAAFGAIGKAEFLTFFLGALEAAVPGFRGPPMDPPPLPFQVADPAVLRQRMQDAGLADVVVTTVTWQMAFTSASHFWDLVTNSNPIGAMLVADLTDGQAAAVKQVLDGMLRERSGGRRGATLSAELNIGVGTA